MSEPPPTFENLNNESIFDTVNMVKMKIIMTKKISENRVNVEDEALIKKAMINYLADELFTIIYCIATDIL